MLRPTENKSQSGKSYGKIKYQVQKYLLENEIEKLCEQYLSIFRMNDKVVNGIAWLRGNMNLKPNKITEPPKITFQYINEFYDRDYHTDNEDEDEESIS
jgi:hypothetical protein